jgi:hypothetical protein
MARDSGVIIRHSEALDPHHMHKPMVRDFELAYRRWFDRFNDAINELDPNAQPASLDTLAEPAPVAADPQGAGIMLGENTGGLLLVGDELEAHRTQRIGRVAAHARGAIRARFTADEAALRQTLHSQSLAAQSNAAPPLTDGELEALHALDADHDWAVSTRDHADALVDALLAAGDSAALDAVDLEDGWP